jgi:hypothetical protein
MTVSAVGFSGPTWVQYPGNGAATTFNIPFLLTAALDLVVGFIAGGTYTQQTIGFALTVAYPGTGTITFTTAPPTGTTVDLRSQIPETQPTNFANLGGYYPENTTNAADRITRLITDLYRLTYLFGIHGPDQENTAWTALPSAAARANSLLAFDSNGLPTIGVQNSGTLLTQTQFNAFLTSAPTGGAQTAAEILAGVVPTNYGANPGNIMRYGASTALADNSTAINAALLVSSFGGPAANIPGGTWNTAAALIAPAGSSMVGSGTSSVINVANGVDGLQFTASDIGILPRSRIFRDFRLVGTLSGTSNNAHAIYINAGIVSHVAFDNISIQGFQYGAYVQGLYYSVFINCYIENVWQGITFNNQSIGVHLISNTIQNGGAATITGSGFSFGVLVQGAPEIESLKITNNEIYGFNYLIYLGLIQECQIYGNDLSNGTMCALFFTSTIRSLSIRDNLISMGATSGTWAGGGAPNLTGIYCNAVTPATSTKVRIAGNEIYAFNLLTGSVGIYLGNGNNGINVSDNNISGFDIGIGGGNGTTTTGGASAGMTIQGNQITANTSSILINSLSSELTLGPNYITAGGQVTFNAGTPASLFYNQPNAPMKGRATFAAGTTVAVTFTNALPVGVVPYVTLSGNNSSYCSVTGESNTGFTINCAVSNSNSVDWHISV